MNKAIIYFSYCQMFKAEIVIFEVYVVILWSNWPYIYHLTHHLSAGRGTTPELGDLYSGPCVVPCAWYTVQSLRRRIQILINFPGLTDVPRTLKGEMTLPRAQWRGNYWGLPVWP